MNQDNPYAAPQTNLNQQASRDKGDAPYPKTTLEAEQFQLFSAGALILAVLWSPLSLFMMPFMEFGPWAFFCLTIGSTIAVCLLCKLPRKAAGKFFFVAAAVLLIIGNLIMLADCLNITTPWSWPPKGSSTMILNISCTLIVPFLLSVGFYQVADSLRVEGWAQASLIATFLIVLLGGMWTTNIWADNDVLGIVILLVMIVVYLIFWGCIIPAVYLAQTLQKKLQELQSSLTVSIDQPR